MNISIHISNKIKAILIAILSMFMAFCMSSNNIYADDNTNNTYSLNSGISITLPEEYKDYVIWNQADENSHGWKNIGYPSFDTMLQMLTDGHRELDAFRNDMSGNSGYRVSVREYDAPEDLSNESLLSTYFNQQVLPYSYEDLPVFGYGVSKINNLTFFKIYYESGGDNFDNVYAYCLVTNSGIIHEIQLLNHNLSTDIYHLDFLTYSIMSTITFSDELVKDAVTLNGDIFNLNKGFHQTTFNFENSDGSNAINTNTTVVNKTPYQKFISFEFPIWIIGITLVFILLYKAKISKKGEWQENALSLENSRSIQGFCAVAIIIHHLAQELTMHAGVLSIFSELGVLFVGVFFFFSGYGLYISLKTKQNYLKGFLKKRLTSVLIPFYVCILIFIICACIEGQQFSLPNLFATISGWLLINQHMWYIVEITILYIAFYIIYSLIKNHKVATSVMTIFVVTLIVGSLLLGHGSDMSCKYWFMGEWWYNTTLTFVFGIVVAQNETKLRSFARKFYALLLPLFIALTVGFYYLTKYALNTWSYWNEYPGYPGYKEKLLCLIIQLPWVIFFVIALLLIMMKVKFGNRILSFLGNISLELYLIHNLFLVGLHDNSIMAIKSNSLYITLTILTSICFATLIHEFDDYIICLINQSKKVAINESDNRIHSIDVLRIVMAFLVVTIHIPFNGAAGNVFITYGKIAVPFFLVTCGYFLYRDDGQEMMQRLKKQAIRMLIFYVASNIVYFFANVILASLDGYSLHYTSKQIIDFILYNMSPFSEHLWFFGSLLYALVILMILNKFKLIDCVMFIAPLLICLYVLLSHLNVAQAYVLRNVVLVGLPYVMMGMLIRRYQDKLLKIKSSVLWVLFLVLSASAIIELNTYKQGINVPFISCEILVYIIFLLALKYPNFGKDTIFERMGFELSLPIYILHVLVMMFIGYLIPANSGLISNYGAITVFIISALLAALYKFVKNIIVSKLSKNKQ